MAVFGKNEKSTRRIRLPFESKDEKPYIFASYGHDDKEKVFLLLKSLYESGYNIWYDEGITIGEKYDDVIERVGTYWKRRFLRLRFHGISQVFKKNGVHRRGNLFRMQRP